MATKQLCTYAVLRRNGWASKDELQQAASQSAHLDAEQTVDDIRWLRSYVLGESAAGLETVCVYQATSAGKIREHATHAGLPIDEIIAIEDTVVMA